MIFVTSDLHLSFSSDKPMHVFGEHWRDHYIKIEKNWREKVNDNDTVVIVGDISWAMKLDDAKVDIDWISELPGKKIISKGNHDYWWGSLSKMGAYFPDISFLQNNSYIVENIGIIGTRGWTPPSNPENTELDNKIYARELQRLKLSITDLQKKPEFNSLNEIYCFIHYPPFDDYSHTSPLADIIYEFNENSEVKITKVLFGHVHSSHEKVRQGRKNNIDFMLITCDYCDFSVIRL